MKEKNNYHKQPTNRQEYEAWQKKLAEQEIESENNDVITCVCGQIFEAKYLYKCYFCGLWFCASCAKEHFGKRKAGRYTYLDYMKEKNNEIK